MELKIAKGVRGAHHERSDEQREREDFVLYELLCLRCDKDPAAEPEELRRARGFLRRSQYAAVPK
jgi:hypothetical protein